MLSEILQAYLSVHAHSDDDLRNWSWALQGWWVVDMDFDPPNQTPWFCVYRDQPEIVDPEFNYGCRVKGYNLLDAPLTGVRFSWLNAPAHPRSHDAVPSWYRAPLEYGDNHEPFRLNEDDWE